MSMNIKGAKLRRADFLDASTNQPKYGIEIKIPTKTCWLKAGDGVGPYLYDSEDQREEKLKELRKETRLSKEEKSMHGWSATKNITASV